MNIDFDFLDAELIISNIDDVGIEVSDELVVTPISTFEETTTIINRDLGVVDWDEIICSDSGISVNDFTTQLIFFSSLCIVTVILFIFINKYRSDFSKQIYLHKFYHKLKQTADEIITQSNLSNFSFNKANSQCISDSLLDLNKRILFIESQLLVITFHFFSDIEVKALRLKLKEKIFSIDSMLSEIRLKIDDYTYKSEFLKYKEETQLNLSAVMEMSNPQVPTECYNLCKGHTRFIIGDKIKMGSHFYIYKLYITMVIS